jgi:protein gp37
MASSSIEWTDIVWNPTVGCTKVSAGCKHCYAERQHARLTRMGQAKYAEPFEVVKPWAPQLADPLTWTKPARVFVNSMSDLFHEDVPDEYIAAVFGVMAAAPQHTFQVLTKRAERMARGFEWVAQQGPSLHCLGAARGVRWYAWNYLANTPSEDVVYPSWSGPTPKWTWPLPNAWIGVSVENQEQADARIPHLLRTPAAVRFLSCEPLLGPLDLLNTRCIPPSENAVDWVIVGGESGPDARPMHPSWARGVRDQCVAAGVPFFFKQWGQWREIDYDRESPPGDRDGERYLNVAGGHGFHGDQVVRIRRSTKHATGRELDGRTWDEYPAVCP